MSKNQVTASQGGDGKLSYLQFTKQAIVNLRKPGFKCIHVVFSGFNSAFRTYYGTDPRPVLDELERQGHIVTRPAKGGATIRLAADAKKKSVEGYSHRDTAVINRIIGRSNKGG